MTRKYDTQFLKAFGARVAALRKQRGLTQEHLAEVTDLHRTYIGFVEQGKRNPSIQNVYRIAKSLKTTLSELLAAIDR